jgi:transposase
MQNAGPDYEKLYLESLEKLARAQELVSDYEHQVNDYQHQVSSYEQQIDGYQHQVSSYEHQILLLKHELNGLRRKVFGSITDNQVQRATQAGQLDLFTLGAPAHLQEQAEEALKQDIRQNNAEKKPRTPRTATRMVLPEEMEREEVILDPQADLSGYHVIGEQVTEILVHVPGYFKIKRIIRRKWALTDSADIERKGILIAPIPSRTVRRGLFDESLLAQLLTSKYIDHLPLYRQQKIFERAGIKIPPSTLSDNTAAACQALEPIYRALKRQTLANVYLQADETGCKVQQSGKKGQCHAGFFWAYHAPADGLVFFDYQKSRDHTGPEKILKDFSGVLQTDAYKAYQKLFKNSKKVTQLYCMAHIRRQFDEAAGHDLARASYAVKEIAKLYAIEKKIRESSPPMTEDQIVKLRMEEAKPVLDRMKAWLLEQQAQKLPGPIGKAVAYALPLWDNMYVYLLHGHLQIDNNGIENAIRPIAIGRKNYMFCGTHQSAQNAAMIYSLFATCHKHGVNPHEWLIDVLRKINDPDYEGRYSDLLPHRWKSNQNNTP